jgi:hypothetical protein
VCVRACVCVCAYVEKAGIYMHIVLVHL